MLTAPAHPWLWSSHDVAHHHHRRYRPRGFRGLFEGGDNVQSPPDSAFTINDACDVHHLLRDADAALVPLREALAAVIRAAAPALLAGGVHTPNHRWELSAALARIHRSFPDDRLVARVDEWLAEGVDIDADGWFSERSPNYAAAVSIPSLTAIADILDRPALRAAVLRNLELGAYSRDDRHEVARGIEEMLSLFPILKERAGQLAGTMSGGEQQMLAIARGLMARPRLLMLDEPSWGIAPKFVAKVLEVIQQVNASGVSILLVEQNLHKALGIAHHGYVIQTGRIVMQGSGQDLLHDEGVRKAYLGL